ncbi:MAG: DEAD/DEAH box helicase family protein [Bacteroidales bacterium]|nr:DEAD/DEAH box helicase family protein [Bacteroidales bacterium]
MKNFDYLKKIDTLNDLYHFCRMAENSQQSDNDVCALNCRRGLEWVVKAIYTLKGIAIERRDSLYELITGAPFVEFVNDERVLMAAHYIRKVGNTGAHSGGVSKRESFFCLLNLYNVVGAILLKLRIIDTLKPFDKELIPANPMYIKTVADVKAPSEEFVASVDSEAVEHPAKADFDRSISEAETREMFINLMLKEAKWDILTLDGAIAPSKACIEIEVSGMPNNSGVGYADYVLFGANGKPLAVIEAKKTAKSSSEGKHQAELYAKCLEEQYGVKPVIYYSNGYETYIIDGLGYPPRKIYGFHTEDDLNVLIQRRGRKNITDLNINPDITDREYQKRGIRALCDHLNKNHRRGLLVMATGTGKTRVAISLTDVLMRNEWAKSVLFLADRTALVNQAAKNFAKLLPNITTTVLSENREPDLNARIMFSTYQTMINYIDTDIKKFSVGRFDLIIIDEAHRSVFGKYTAIFDYFDCFLVGLTATPREDVDRSTYDLFELEGGEPNFSYELEEAIKDKYLVPYTHVARTTEILKRGIKYNSLTEDEKMQLEEVWKYEKAKNALDLEQNGKGYYRDIDKKEIFKYIFNKDTIDKVLIDLMSNGLKIQGGDLIGKTIIFAYNHKHAELIVERFNAIYPQYGSDFCVLIDYSVNYAQDLINTFEVRDKRPQIAVSVAMLDTGIDVLDILNLVFFKPIYSYIKFWQMIGRGTRLSQDIFDVGEDKQEFYIFDWCGNFEFFNQHPRGKEPLAQISVTERLFGIRVDMAQALQHQKYQSDPFAKKLHDEIKDILHKQVAKLNDHHISVRQHWVVVDKYRKESTWAHISNVDTVELKDIIAPLVYDATTDLGAKKFDILMVNIQLSMISDEYEAERTKVKVYEIAQALQEKASIPQVASKMPLIREVSTPRFWEAPKLDRLEYVRKELRDLVQFILGTSNKTFTINIKDTVETLESSTGVVPRLSYKQRIIDYLAKNKNLPVLQKIFKMEKLEHSDIIELERICWKELGTKEEYQKYIERGQMICGDSVAAFIRAQIGVDRRIALEKFSEFLSDNVLNSTQEEYIKTIITYVCENGDISLPTLVNDTPFCDFNWVDVFGQNMISVRKYVEDFHSLIA